MAKGNSVFAFVDGQPKLAACVGLVQCTVTASGTATVVIKRRKGEEWATTSVLVIRITDSPDFIRASE